MTKDDLVCLASESGVLPFAEEDIVRKWRLQPGRMLLIDLEQGRIIEDEELKAQLANAEPYEEWLQAAQYNLADLETIETHDEAVLEHEVSLLDRQQAFGYTQEDIAKFLEPMAVLGDDPIGSMGTDTPIAVLSKRSRLLYDYFKQNFAQVTNPPIDPIREELVMSLLTMVGPRPNLLGHEAGTHKRLEISQPILTSKGMEKIRSVEASLDGAFRTGTIDITWDADDRGRWPRNGDQGNVLGRDRGGAAGPEHPDPLGPRAGAGPDSHARAARHGGRAPPTGAAGAADADRDRGGNRRSARSASLLRAGGLWRGSDQSLSRLRDAGRYPPPQGPGIDPRSGREELHQGGGQGHPEGDVQDGHFHLPVLLRGADF